MAAGTWVCCYGDGRQGIYSAAAGGGDLKRVRSPDGSLSTCTSGDVTRLWWLGNSISSRLISLLHGFTRSSWPRSHSPSNISITVFVQILLKLWDELLLLTSQIEPRNFPLPPPTAQFCLSPWQHKTDVFNILSQDKALDLPTFPSVWGCYHGDGLSMWYYLASIGQRFICRI